MSSIDELQTALDELWVKYGNTLKMLNKALDDLDKKPTEVVVEKTVEVEKIVEVNVPVPNTLAEQKLMQVTAENKSLKQQIAQLKQDIKKKPKTVEKIVEVEREVPVEIEKEASGDLREAARLLSISEFNKEDLSEDEIYNMLQKSSEDEVKKKIGFWAMPLPTADDSSESSNKKYIGKSR